MLVTQMHRDSTDSLPSWAWPGGYPLAYFTQEGSVLCPECATSELDQALSGDDLRRHDLPHWADILWEGPPEHCDECSRDIETAYGPVEGE